MRNVRFLAAIFTALGLIAGACGGSEFSSDDGEGDGSVAGGGRAMGGKVATGGGRDSPSSMSGGTSSAGKPAGAAGAAGAAAAGAGGAAFGAGAAFGSGAAPAPSTGGGPAFAGPEQAEGGAGGELDFSSAECADGSVTFRMLPGAELAAGALCEASCGTGWLTVTDAEGAMAFPLFAACGTATCDHCETLACPNVACLLEPVAKTGLEFVWQGAYFAQGVCGANLECLRGSCVRPGKYRARACAAVSASPGSDGSCSPSARQLCAEAEFEFPGPREVTLTLSK